MIDETLDGLCMISVHKENNEDAQNQVIDRVINEFDLRLKETCNFNFHIKNTDYFYNNILLFLFFYFN